MQRNPVLLAGLGLSLLFAGLGTAPAQAQQVPQEILILGNSFARGVQSPLRRMFQHGLGVRLRVKTVAPAGWTLSKHLSSNKTLRHLSSREWDRVILQEQSAGTWQARYPHAEGLDAIIRAHGSSSMFLMTWRDRDDPPAAYDSLRGVVGGNVGYVPIAAELGVPIAPAGWAIRTAVASGLPYDLWGTDGHHLNDRGRYLVACVLYAALTGESPVGTWAPGALLHDGSALPLQELAATVVLDQPADWFLEF